MPDLYVYNYPDLAGDEPPLPIRGVLVPFTLGLLAAPVVPSSIDALVEKLRGLVRPELRLWLTFSSTLRLYHEDGSDYYLSLRRWKDDAGWKVVLDNVAALSRSCVAHGVDALWMNMESTGHEPTGRHKIDFVWERSKRIPGRAQQLVAAMRAGDASLKIGLHAIHRMAWHGGFDPFCNAFYAAAGRNALHLDFDTLYEPWPAQVKRLEARWPLAQIIPAYRVAPDTDGAKIAGYLKRDPRHDALLFPEGTATFDPERVSLWQTYPQFGAALASTLGETR